MKVFDWICPFCGRWATITDESVHNASTEFTIENSEGPRQLRSVFIVCPNPNCKKFTLNVFLYEIKWEERIRVNKPVQLLRKWQLIPASKAQSYPDYIPKAIIDDYNEACLIVDLSPKASGTLSRRCLQGILRDFWKVKPGRLVDEIEQIKDKTDPLTWSAIDTVRKVGNIGAHMEEDINIIVDVEPNEAELLIGLIETLLKDWYIAREDRKAQLQKIAALSSKKDAAKSPE